MSDNFITLIPTDPRHVPDLPRWERARQRYAEIAPRADKIEVRVYERIQFFSCVANFERVLCPECRAEIPADAWVKLMDQDYDGGFNLRVYPMPCCGTRCTLPDLIYEWPQGFALVGLEGMNPDIGRLDDKYKAEFEELLGIPLRVIYQHI